MPTTLSPPANEQNESLVPQFSLIEEREQRRRELYKLFELEAKGPPASEEQVAGDAGTIAKLQLARRSSKVSQLGVVARAVHDSRRQKRFTIIEEANQRFTKDRSLKASLYGRGNYERLLDEEREEANKCCVILNASIAHLVQLLMGIAATLQLYLLVTMAQSVSFTAILLSAIASSIALVDVFANLVGLLFDLRGYFVNVHMDAATNEIVVSSVSEEQDTASTLPSNGLGTATYEEYVVTLTSTVVKNLKEAVAVSPTWFSLFDYCGVGGWLRRRVASGYGALAAKFTSYSGVYEFLSATVTLLLTAAVTIAAGINPLVVVAAASAAAILASSAAKSSGIAEKPKGCTAEALGSQLRQSPMKSLVVFIGTVLAMDSGIRIIESTTVFDGDAMAKIDHAELALRLPSSFTFNTTSFTPPFIPPSAPPLPLLPSPSLPPLPPPTFHRWWALHESPSPPPTLPSPIPPPLVPPPLVPPPLNHPPHSPPLKPPPPPSSPLAPSMPMKESDGKSRFSDLVALAVQLSLVMVC